MPKKITTGIIFLIIIVIIVNLGRQIASALNSGSRLDQAADSLSQLQKQNQELKKQLLSSRQYDFLEKVARNELNLTKEGETLVIIPKSAINQILAQEDKFILPKVPNWEGWMRLIFH